MLQIMHSNVLSDTIRPLGPHVFWGDLVSLFWILLLTASWNLQFLVIVLCWRIRTLLLLVPWNTYCTQNFCDLRFHHGLLELAIFTLPSLANVSKYMSFPSIPTGSTSFLIYINYGITSDNWTHRYEKIGTRTSAIYKLIVGIWHRPLFCVIDYAFKCYERYNLTVGASRLLGRPCHHILDPRVGGFTKYPIPRHCF